ncbi:CIA30 family protein [uncultured Shimia sp.]|uniref:CIA30 family protein n=1 Tax=uncultured Shimia sp. TaxID=573152 RepID=UPI0026115CC3|nr:CIA30 family protein [uncultured Shimia sp.]
MRLVKKRLFAIVLASGLGTSVGARGQMFEDFEMKPDLRWDFVADTVMGGVSTGSVKFLTEGDVAFARMTGTVSTQNRGGFIQFRRKFEDRLPDEVTGVRLVVRGNAERYFVHLRTTGAMLPWQYYQSGFESKPGWQEIRLPLSSFDSSGSMLRNTPRAGTIISVGVVAYGRDYDALIDVREIDFY